MVYNQKYLEKMKGGENMKSAILKGKMSEKSLTQNDVAQRIGLSLSRFNAKLNGYNGAEFSLGEVRAMKKLLELTTEQIDSIFFS